MCDTQDTHMHSPNVEVAEAVGLERTVWPDYPNLFWLSLSVTIIMIRARGKVLKMCGKLPNNGVTVLMLLLSLMTILMARRTIRQR